MSEFRVAESSSATYTKIKAAAKAEVMDYIEECLKAKYGEDKVGYVRTGNGESKTKELAVLIGAVEVAGEDCPMTVCVNATGKNYRDITNSKGAVSPTFNFNVAREEYEIYLEEKAQKAKAAGESKAKKTAKAKAAKESFSDYEDF